MIYYPRVTLFVDGKPKAIPQRAVAISNGTGQDITVKFQPSAAGEALELASNCERRREHSLPERFMKKVTVIIPCHNEAEGITGVITGFPRKQLKSHGYELEVLVINNRSTDNTRAWHVRPERGW